MNFENEIWRSSHSCIGVTEGNGDIDHRFVKQGIHHETIFRIGSKTLCWRVRKTEPETLVISEKTTSGADWQIERTKEKLKDIGIDIKNTPQWMKGGMENQGVRERVRTFEEEYLGINPHFRGRPSGD